MRAIVDLIEDESGNERMDDVESVGTDGCGNEDGEVPILMKRKA